MPSVVGLALATVATGALREVMPETDFRVEFNPDEPVELIDTVGQRALVCVFLGDEIHKTTRRRLFEGSRTIELVVQVILPAAVTLTAGGVALAPKAQAAGALVAFATAHRLIETAFAVGPAGSWRALLQAFVTGFPEELHALPGVVDRPNKVKHPLEDYSIPCETIYSPAIGQPLPYPWPDIVQKMRTEPRFSALADYFEALLTGTPLPLWQAEQVRAGLSIVEGNALGLGVVDPLTDTPPTGGLVVEAPLGPIVVTQDAAP